MAKKRALLVAINDYPGTRNDLGSCLNDLAAMEQAIADDFGFADIKSLQDGDATTAKVEAALKDLLKNAALGDQLFFFYSGHGTQVQNGTMMEEALCLFDGTYADDKIVELAQGLPPGVLTVFLDSCFSGGMDKRLHLFLSDSQGETGRSKFALPDSTDELIANLKAQSIITSYRPFGCFPIKSKFTEVGLQKSFKAASDTSDEAGQPQLNGLLIAASSENETASASTSATMGLSAFTFCFLNALSSAKRASVDYLLAQSNTALKSLGFRQTPIVRANPQNISKHVFLSERAGSKGIGISAGGGFVTPFGGGNLGIGIGIKGPQKIIGIDDAILIPAIASVITAAINANRKSPDEKIFGIDDAIFIPVLASVISTAITASQKGVDISAGGGVSSTLGGEISSTVSIEIAREVVQSIRNNNADKIFGIDDVILIPEIASVVSAAISAASKGIAISVGGGVVTPIGGANFGVGFGIKNSQDKVFGIDDAILIPALVSVVTAAINASSKAAAPQEKVFGIDDAILIPALVSVVTAAINASSNGQQKSILQNDSFMVPLYREIRDLINSGRSL
jgi:hypothetical protein